MDVKVTTNPVTGAGKITATPLSGAIAERKDKIRIKEYRQTWTVERVGNNMAHVVLEGYIDPAGNIPDWISNMLIVDSPIKVISGIKQRLERNRIR